MPTKSSWSSSSTSICHRSRPHASPHRESARTPQPPQCSGDLGNPALDLTHFFLRVEKVGLKHQILVVLSAEHRRSPIAADIFELIGDVLAPGPEVGEDSAERQLVREPR